MGDVLCVCAPWLTVYFRFVTINSFMSSDVRSTSVRGGEFVEQMNFSNSHDSSYFWLNVCFMFHYGKHVNVVRKIYCSKKWMAWGLWYVCVDEFSRRSVDYSQRVSFASLRFGYLVDIRLGKTFLSNDINCGKSLETEQAEKERLRITHKRTNRTASSTQIYRRGIAREEFHRWNLSKQKNTLKHFSVVLRWAYSGVKSFSGFFLPHFNIDLLRGAITQVESGVLQMNVLMFFRQTFSISHRVWHFWVVFWSPRTDVGGGVVAKSKVELKWMQRPSTRFKLNKWKDFPRTNRRLSFNSIQWQLSPAVFTLLSNHVRGPTNKSPTINVNNPIWGKLQARLPIILKQCHTLSYVWRGIPRQSQHVFQFIDCVLCNQTPLSVCGKCRVAVFDSILFEINRNCEIGSPTLRLCWLKTDTRHLNIYPFDFGENVNQRNRKRKI